MSASPAPDGDIQTVTDDTGRLYFCVGKTRIRIVEHFPDRGQNLENALSNLILQIVRENLEKSA